MITDRQQKILNLLIKEYIDTAEPVSSQLLAQKYQLDVSPATIRNDFQVLADEGYIRQPHTSAGRVPTDQGYQYFVEITFSVTNSKVPDFIYKEIQEAKEQIEKELRLAQELMNSFHEMSAVLNFETIEKDMMLDILKVIGPSKSTYHENMDLMKELIKKLENL